MSLHKIVSTLVI